MFVKLDHFLWAIQGECFFKKILVKPPPSLVILGKKLPYFFGMKLLGIKKLYQKFVQTKISQMPPKSHCFLQKKCLENLCEKSHARNRETPSTKSPLWSLEPRSVKAKPTGFSTLKENLGVRSIGPLKMNEAKIELLYYNK